MPMFVGREAELHLLDAAYGGRDAAFIPIYGRRRVGKSELILQFLKDKPALYFVGKQAPRTLQIAEFLREAAIVTGEPLLASMKADDWRSALVAIDERSRQKRIVLAFDEFQWTVETSPELPSVLQELWDRRWRSSGRVFLILCGSFIGFMEREVLGRKSPLYGRRTAQILLRPFGYQEASEFHSRWALEERTRAYFVCGGVPLYLKLFDKHRSVEQNIEHLLLDEMGALAKEPEFLLREELREVPVYHAVLRAIAAGHARASAIAEQSGLPERSIHYYVEQLASLGYIARHYPLSGGKPVSRHVRYVLEDPLLRFWFRFVFPNQSFVHSAGPSRSFRDRIRPEIEAYWGSCFERLCREALHHIYLDEGVQTSFEIGEYWDRDVQIDVVGVREDRWTDLGECKWGAVRSLKVLERELDAKIHRYPNLRGHTLDRRYFVRRRPRGGLPGKGWFSLEDLYDA